MPLVACNKTELGLAQQNQFTYLDTWSQIRDIGEGVSSDLSIRPQAPAMMFDNTTVTGSVCEIPSVSFLFIRPASFNIPFEWPGTPETFRNGSQTRDSSGKLPIWAILTRGTCSGS